MRHRLLLAAAALLTLAACSDSSTAPQPLTPGAPQREVMPDPDGSCRAGYVAATRADGSVVCEAG